MNLVSAITVPGQLQCGGGTDHKRPRPKMCGNEAFHRRNQVQIAIAGLCDKLTPSSFVDDLYRTFKNQFFIHRANGMSRYRL